MGDGGPSTSYNSMNVPMFQPHNLKVESICASRCGRGMERDGYVIREGIRESLTSDEGECIIPRIRDEEPI